MPDGKDPFLEPRLNEEQVKAYKEYREGGGLLGYYEWVDAGMPSITEEKSSFAWLARLDAYLVSQMEQDFITEPEADVIWDDMKDRFSGQGKYAGERQTILDLPASIRNDVENYWTSLPVEAQKAAEREAAERAQMARDIATQRMQLPLGVRGTPQQQVNAGYDAIRNLKIQMGAAPAYLQTEMLSQVAQLEEAINQIQENIRATARARTEDEQYIREEGRQAGEGMFAQDFAKQYGMPAAEAERMGYRYSQNQQSEEFADLPLEVRQDLAWVGMEAGGGPEPPPKPITIEPPEFREVGVSGAPSWKRWFEMNYPSITRQFKQQPASERTSSGWSEFLEKERKRIREEFMKQSPYQRGERPGAFQPRIKTVDF